MYLKEIGWEGEDWIDLAHYREKYESGTEPSGSIKCEKFLD